MLKNGMFSRHPTNKTMDKPVTPAPRNLFEHVDKLSYIAGSS